MLELLLTYKYWILFPLTIVEGPIVTIISGFLSTIGVMNAFFVFIIVVTGDLVGDSTAYAFGRWGSGKLLQSYGHYIGVTQKKLDNAKKIYATNHKKTIFLSKVLYGIGTVGLIAAGSLKIPFLRYIKTCVLITLAQAVVMLIVGVTFGHLYVQIGKYLDYYAATVSVMVLVIAGILILRYYKRKTI